MELRPYQQEAKDAVLNEWDEGRKKTLLVLPTGTGKTIVFSNVIKDATKEGQHSLVLAHRNELVQQAADKLQSACGIEADFCGRGRKLCPSEKAVTVGTVQTMSGKRALEKYPADYFTNIVVDEAHHALSSSYQRLLDHFDGANILGVTATPDRGDKKELGTCFDSIAYEYPMKKAIEEGWLSPIKAQLIPLKLDISDVRTTAGDYSCDDLGDALDPYLSRIATEMTNYCHGRKTLVFLPLIKTADKLCALLNEKGLKAAEVHGTSRERETILAEFRSGKYDVLCNSMLLTEGYDDPSIDCVVILRPTKSRSLYQQMVGRGTRICEGKGHLLLLDFLWLTTRHDLCRPSSLVCGSTEQAGKMNAGLKNGEAQDILAAAEAAERAVMQDRENTLARQLAQMRTREKRLVDPMQYFFSIAAEDLIDYTPTFNWEKAPPERSQLDWLEKHGLSTCDVDSFGLAATLIDRMRRRYREGLATPRQIRCLERFGFEHVGTWKFEAANAMIGRLSANHWQLPYDFIPSKYVPEGGLQL